MIAHLPSLRFFLPSPAALCGVVACLACCGREPAPPAPQRAQDLPVLVGGDVPLTAERFKGARLASIQGATTWDFTDTHFTLANRDGSLPPNVAASILGPGIAAKSVAGDWRFDGQARVMILSNLERDGEKTHASASLPIHAAGAVRVNFGTEQYNIFPPEIVRRMGR